MAALRDLWGCWGALAEARDKREPLGLDLPERQVALDEKGRLLSVAPRERLDAHRLVMKERKGDEPVWVTMDRLLGELLRLRAERDRPKRLKESQAALPLFTSEA